MKINYFTGFYFDKNIARAKELHDCCIANLDNVLFTTKYIYIDAEKDYNKVNHFLNKIHNKNNVSHQFILNKASYKDYFNRINSVSGENDINIIANLDIIFDNTLSKIVEFAKRQGKAAKDYCFAINRDDLPNRVDTQDVWVFFGPIKKEIKNSDINLGISGCDNVIAYELQQAGYKVINPSLSVNCIHNHKSNVRNYINEDGELNQYKSPPYNYLRVKPQKI